MCVMAVYTEVLSLATDVLATARAAQHWWQQLLGMGTGETFKNISAGVASVATAVAIIVGGWWAYFKFAKGRTYKPRLSVEMAGQWCTFNSERQVFHVRIRVTNIGASKVTLKRSGTGLRISLPAKEQSESPDSFNWEPLQTNPVNGQPPKKRTFEIFTNHRVDRAGRDYLGGSSAEHCANTAWCLGRNSFGLELVWARQQRLRQVPAQKRRGIKTPNHST